MSRPPRTTGPAARRARSAARFYAVQALFQMEAADIGLPTVLEEFETHRLGADVARWPIDRIDPTLRALFRAAGAELVATDTPPRVTISEYLEVAKAFYPDGKEARFVNA